MSDEEDSDDGSVHEMKLSKDYYQASLPQKSQLAEDEEDDDDDDDGSVHEMKLSKDYYQASLPQKSQFAEEQGTAPQPFFAMPKSFAQALAQRPPQPPIQQLERRSSTSRGRSVGLAAQPMAEEEPFPSFKDDHFAAVYPEYDEPNVAHIFGEQSGVPGPGDVSKNVQEDIEHLKDLGFLIDYTRSGFLGEGFYGQVYRGYYAPSTHGLKDIRALQPFAVKMIDFAEDDLSDNDSYQSTGKYTLERRECYETEKWILTSVHHKNLVTTRQVINMGEQRQFEFIDHPGNYYLSPDRIYIIMDYADGGDFESWWKKHARGLDPYVRIYMIRDLFAGLLYLHNMGIIHGDIHSGNILMFTENGMWVPKWSDFGLGYVDASKQYRFRVSKFKLPFIDRAKNDILHFGEVMRKILSQRNLGKPETPEEKAILDEMANLSRWIIKNKPGDIKYIFQQYRHILEEPLEIHPDFF